MKFALVLSLAAPALYAGAAPDLSELGASVTAALERIDGSDARQESGVRELAALGPEAAPILFSALSSDRPPGSDDALPALSDAQEDALIAGLVRLGREPLSALFSGAAEPAATDADRVAALRVLEPIAGARDLALAARTATPSTEESDLGAGVRDAFESTTVAILRRDAAAPKQLPFLFLEAHPATAMSLARSVGAAGIREGPEILTGLLGRHAGLDRTLLGEIGAYAERTPRPPEEWICDEVRALLDGNDPQLVREAALACGRLEDSRAVAALIDLLEHEEEGVRQAAHWALQRVTMLAFAAEPSRWKLWHESERSWLEAEAPGVFLALDRRKSARVIQALNEISGRRLHRRELAARVQAVLDHPDHRVRALACSVLRQLDTITDAGPLAELLEDPNGEVSGEALATLRAVTGWDLEARSEVWIGSWEDS